MVFEEIGVMQTALDQDSHYAERERGVGAGAGLQVPVGQRRAPGHGASASFWRAPAAS